MNSKGNEINIFARKIIGNFVIFVAIVRFHSTTNFIISLIYIHDTNRQTNISVLYRVGKKKRSTTLEFSIKKIGEPNFVKFGILIDHMIFNNILHFHIVATLTFGTMYK